MKFQIKICVSLLMAIMSFSPVSAFAAGTSEEAGVFSPFMDIRSNSNKTKVVTSSFDTSTPKSFSSLLLGLSIVYKPVKAVMFNFDVFGGGTYFSTRKSSSGSTYETTLKGASFGAAYSGRFSEKFSCSLGGGFTAVHGQWRDVPLLGKPVTITIPYVKAGIEYKPKNKFALSIAVRYDLKKIEIKDRAAVPNTLVEFSQLAIQPALAFYF